MMFYRACPRCATGTVYDDRDAYGPFLLCLQCGYMKDFEEGEDPWRVLVADILSHRDMVDAAGPISA